MVLNEELVITKEQAVALYNVLEDVIDDCESDGIGYSSILYANRVINDIRKSNGMEQSTSLVFDDEEVLV